MIAENQTKSNIGVGVGFVISVAGRVLAAQAVTSHTPILTPIGIVLSLAGTVLFIWGCVNYAQGKGYSPWLGLLGLLSCIGLLVLVFLPDKNKGGAMPPPGAGGYRPPQPGVWPPPPGAGQAPPPLGQPPSGDPPPPRKSLSGEDL